MGTRAKKERRAQKKAELENPDTENLDYDPEIDDSVCLNCGWEGFPEVLSGNGELVLGCPKCGSTAFGSKNILG